MSVQAATASGPADDGGAFVLAPLGHAHLGDVLCTSPLPRLLTIHRGLAVYAVAHPMLRHVFQSNPFVRGFVSGGGLSPDASASGNGHVIQRVLQGYELPIPPIPKPEIYLDSFEQQWAREERMRWPSDRPVCILSCGAITDKQNLEQVNWTAVSRLLLERYTVVQPVLSDVPLPGAIVYRDLDVRRYFSLFSVADCFVGGTSGGSHVAAAFDVPAVVVTWRSLQKNLQFPVSGLGIRAAFLYPQHWFVPGEDLTEEQWNRELLTQALDQVAKCGRGGRPTAIGNHPLNPCAFAPKPPARISVANGRRILRAPAAYGEGVRVPSP